MAVKSRAGRLAGWRIPTRPKSSSLSIWGIKLESLIVPSERLSNLLARLPDFAIKSLEPSTLWD